MTGSTSTCSLIMLKNLLVIVLLITCASSQRRWAGSYPTEAPLLENAKANNRQLENDKHAFEDVGHLKPEDPQLSMNQPKEPQHSMNRPDNPYLDTREDEANTDGRGKDDWLKPETVDDSRRQGDRKNTHPRVDDGKKHEISTNERSSTVTQVVREYRVNSDRNDRRNSNSGGDVPSTNSGERRDNNPSGAGRVIVISKVIPKETRPMHKSEDDTDFREDSLSRLEPEREDKVPSRDGRRPAVAHGIDQQPVSENNERIYPESRNTYFLRTDSDRRVFMAVRNSSRSENKDYSEHANNRNDRDSKINNEHENNGRSSTESRDNPRNFRPNRGSNQDDRQETRPKFERPVARSSGTSILIGSRKEDKFIPEESGKTGEQRPVFDNPFKSETAMDDCEKSESPRCRENKSRLDPFPSSFDSGKDIKTVSEIRPPWKDTPRITGQAGTGIEERIKAGFRPDVSYDTIVFPKDDAADDEKYHESDSTYQKGRPLRTRKKRGFDLPEEVEILPGFETSSRRKQVLKNHDDVIIEEEVDVFSPVEIKFRKSR